MIYETREIETPKFGDLTQETIQLTPQGCSIAFLIITSFVREMQQL